MKLGIKCEIHSCTIALIGFLEDEGVIEKGISKKLEDDKELRIDNQYYLKNKSVKINFEELSEFLISIRKSLEKLDDKNIRKIREMLKSKSPSSFTTP